MRFTLTCELFVVDDRDEPPEAGEVEEEAPRDPALIPELARLPVVQPGPRGKHLTQ